MQKAIVASDVRKATGHDYISAKILKMCSNRLAVPLTYLFNLCITDSDFPLLCKYTIVASDVRKATGHDYISAKILKMCSNRLAVPLTYLFNLCITDSDFPLLCKYTTVTSVYKKDDPLTMKNKV